MADDDTPYNGEAPRRLVIENAVATITHLNIRKAGADDAKELAVDLKLTFEKLGARPVVEFFDPLLIGFLWTTDADGGFFVRSPLMEPIAFANEVRDAELRIGRMRWPVCTAKRFALSPVDGGLVTLTCSVSLMPSAAEVAELAKLVQDGAFVSIVQPEDLFAAAGRKGAG